MSIKIDKDLCNSCGRCRDVCPGSLLSADEAGKTENKYPKDCWGCTACLKECDSLAIRYYLGSDIGGEGSYLYVKKEGQLLHWVFVKPDGKETVITVDRNQANAY